MTENEVKYTIMKNLTKISSKNNPLIVSRYENVQGFELRSCIESIYRYQIQRSIQNYVTYLRLLAVNYFRNTLS